MAKIICEDCDAVFIGTIKAHYCPTCVKRRQSEWAKERRLNAIGCRAYSDMRRRAKNIEKECDNTDDGYYQATLAYKELVKDLEADLVILSKSNEAFKTANGELAKENKKLKAEIERRAINENH